MIKQIFLTTLIGGAALAVLAGCASEDELATQTGTPTPTTAPAATPTPPVVDDHDHVGEGAMADADGLAGRIVDGAQELVELPGGDQPPLIVNVSFESGDVWPKQVAVPVGRQVQLVLRNHDQAEHHYHILGMPTEGIRWLSKEEDPSLSQIPQEEHAAHHPEVDLVPFHICTSRSGVCPTGEWIHAHADPADMDMIIFVANTPGSYEVTDPLHPDLSATFTVFGEAI